MPFKPPQDIVAIFHASFHPTKGNALDWFFSVDDELDVEKLGLEFSALPSGLHQLDEDVIYFTAKVAPHRTYHAIALFRRRRTTHPLYRGFLLGSLGILVAESGQSNPRARPWRHLPDLRTVAERCYSRPGSEPSINLVDIESPPDAHWYQPAQEFFEARRATPHTTPGPWTSWEDELYDELRFWIRSNESNGTCTHSPASLTHLTPTLALPSLLSLLGPASLTLYRHLLSRKRILIYTKPPVEYACVLCYAAVDMVRSIQEGELSQLFTDDEDKATLVPPRHSPGDATRVLGMVTLHDLLGSKFSEEDDGTDDDGGQPRTRGWIACTTDALFLEKPSYYDLLVDMTSVGVYSSSTAAFKTSKSAPPPPTSQTSTSTNSWLNALSISHPGPGGRLRPTMYTSVPKHPLPHVPNISAGKIKAKGKTKQEHKKPVHYKRVQTRWAWSDARLWGELDRVLRAPASSTSGREDSGSESSRPPVLPVFEALGEDGGHSKCKSCGTQVVAVPPESADRAVNGALPNDEKPASLGSDPAAWMASVWQLYEDVCLVCAGALMGTLRTRNPGMGLVEREGYAAYFGRDGDSRSTGTGSTLHRSISTPQRTLGGDLAPPSLYKTTTLHAFQQGRVHDRSVSTPGDDELRKMPAFEPIKEDGPIADTLAPLVTGDAEHHDHDFTLVAPPTPDTREGLDILLNTAALQAVLPPNLNLAEIVSKTEGVLAVLDGYANAVVGTLRRRAMDEIGVAPAITPDDLLVDNTGGEENGGKAGVRTSAIELTSAGPAAMSRRSPPPVGALPKGGRFAIQRAGSSSTTASMRVREMNMTLTPRDLLSLDLNPLSVSDVKYLECVQREYASRAQVVALRNREGSGSVVSTENKAAAKSDESLNNDTHEEEDSDATVVEEVNINLVVKRGWRDLAGVVFGL